jgi:transposase-like protein
VVKKIRRKLSPAFKARVAVEALREQKTMPQIASQHGIHSSQVQKWKKELKEGIPGIFEKDNVHKDGEKDALIEELYKQIGKLQVELDWIKKSTDYFG